MTDRENALGVWRRVRVGVGSSGSFDSLYNPALHEKLPSGLQDTDGNPKASFSYMARWRKPPGQEVPFDVSKPLNWAIECAAFDEQTGSGVWVSCCKQLFAACCKGSKPALSQPTVDTSKLEQRICFTGLQLITMDSGAAYSLCLYSMYQPCCTKGQIYEHA